MTRRSLRAALAGAAMLPLLALTACGTTASQAGDAPAESTSADCADDTTATSTEAVSLVDGFGREIELEQPAERVAVLEWQQIEDVLSLCVTPVAAADVEGYTLWDTAEALPEGVADVGTRGEPNLDALYATEPDLVIIEAYTPDDAIIGQLEEYGVPVLATKGADAADPIRQMKDTFSLIAEATGREERAEVVLDDFDAAVEEASDAIAAADPEVTEFAYFDGYVDGGNVSLRFFGQGSLFGELGEAIGLTNAWTGEVDPAYGLGSTDIEGATAVGDATLLYTGTEDPAGDVMAELEKNEIWASLPAVEEERVVPFPGGIWTFGGPRSAQQALDAYVAAFAG